MISILGKPENIAPKIGAIIAFFRRQFDFRDLVITLLAHIHRRSAMGCFTLARPERMWKLRWELGFLPQLDAMQTFAHFVSGEGAVFFGGVGDHVLDAFQVLSVELTFVNC